MNRTRPRLMRAAFALAAAIGSLAESGREVLSDLFSHHPGPSFSERYGCNPKAYNGGTRSGAATIQRAARKRRNIRKHPRSAR